MLLIKLMVIGNFRIWVIDQIDINTMVERLF